MLEIMVNRVLKVEDKNSVCVKEEACTDKMESENDDILPGYKSFEEFREVGNFFFYLLSNLC